MVGVGIRSHPLTRLVRLGGLFTLDGFVFGASKLQLYKIDAYTLMCTIEVTESKAAQWVRYIRYMPDQVRE